jgi:hypothetical protein
MKLRTATPDTQVSNPDAIENNRMPNTYEAESNGLHAHLVRRGFLGVIFYMKGDESRDRRFSRQYHA